MTRPVHLDWRQKVPAEIRTSLEPMIKRRLWRVPSWCHELSIRWDEEETSCAARVFCDPEYRRAQLVIAPAWLTEARAERDRIVAHEMSHLPTLALGKLFDEVLKHFPKDEKKLKAALFDQWVATMEGVTCDLTDAFERKED